MARQPTRTPNAELPMKGLYGVQWRLWLFTFIAPVLAWLLPFPSSLRLLGLALPPVFLAIGLTVIAVLKCPACARPLMGKGLIARPRRQCPHCRETVAN
jgi:hypothetical protein